jgi:ABC-type lipoprotein release transport system permease subunit
MLALSIAARFLRSALGQTALIVAGIGVGIAVQIFVGSLITSLQDDLIDSTVGSSPHVTLLPADGDTLPGDLAATAAEEPEVTAAIPVRRMSVHHGHGDDSAALSVTAGPRTTSTPSTG